jgi:adenylate kinase family enzyme
MRRIAIIGCGGAGKTTLARQLGERLGIEVVHLDVLFWQPGWTETPAPEWEERMRGLVSGESWVLDGNYGGTMAIRLPAADTVIFLDLPRRVCLWGIVWRRFRYAGRSRIDRADGCEEKLDWEFIKYVWRWPHEGRRRVLARLAAHGGHPRLIQLRSRAEMRRFLESMPAQH